MFKYSSYQCILYIYTIKKKQRQICIVLFLISTCFNINKRNFKLFKCVYICCWWFSLFEKVIPLEGITSPHRIYFYLFIFCLFIFVSILFSTNIVFPVSLRVCLSVCHVYRLRPPAKYLRHHPTHALRVPTRSSKEKG